MSKSAALLARTPSAPAQALDQHEQEQLALINAFIVTARHFFGGFVGLFHPIHDPRHPNFSSPVFQCLAPPTTEPTPLPIQSA